MKTKLLISAQAAALLAVLLSLATMASPLAAESAYDEDVIVYTAHQGWLSRIYILDMDGSVIRYFEYEFYYFADLEVVDNEVYVAEAFAPRVLKVDLETGALDVIVDDWSLYYFYDLAFDGTYFYLTEWDLNRYLVDGTKQGTASFAYDVHGGACDDNHYWTLTDAGQIKCWDTSAWPTLMEIPGNAFAPPSPDCRGLWFDGEYFWTAESIDGVLGKIYKFDYDGAVIDQWIEPAFMGWGVCVVKGDQPRTLLVPDEYATIQEAIDDAADGDTVLVGQGVYAENIDFKGKAITVTGKYGPEATVIDGGRAGSVVTFQTGEGPESLLEGFTIANGSGNPVGSPSSCGGGVFCDGASPEIRGNVIADSHAGGNGGGFYGLNSSAVLTGNVIADNTAGSHGGGIAVSTSTISSTCDTIAANTAGIGGGGVVCIDSTMTSANTILWNNGAHEGPQVWVGGPASSTFTIGYSDVKGGQAAAFVDPASTLDWGAGMIDADPLFAGPASGDFHLTVPSPCRNAGDTGDPGLPATDFEGDPRVVQDVVDMGGDEFHTHLYRSGPVVPGGVIDIRIAGKPGEPVTVFRGSGIQDPPEPDPHGDIHLELPVIKRWNPGSIPPEGILSWSVTVPAGAPPGKEYYLQALVGRWSDPGSKLTNLMILRVE